VLALSSRIGRERLQVCATGQHRDLVDPVLDWFGVRKDEALELMTPNQTPAGFAAVAIRRVAGVLERTKPAVVVVQGATTTVFAAAFAAAMCGVPVAHVEAGLRTGDRRRPFPEEINRRLTTALAEVHFAPTEIAVDALRREGVPADRIHLTGNTVVDALQLTLSRTPVTLPVTIDAGRRLILVTAHRRESFGAPLQRICRAVDRLVDLHPDVDVVWPLHPNPDVAATVRGALAGVPAVRLLPPLRYEEFVHLAATAELLLTDSGGIQEKAPALGVPALVLRDVTERPEAVSVGAALVVGTDIEAIVTAADRLLRDPAARSKMTGRSNPFGDGRAAQRIAAVLEELLAPTVSG
jgi:UDP-N-acetylglucosamine 2-epimerase (non-hydrolysing)